MKKKKRSRGVDEGDGRTRCASFFLCQSLLSVSLFAVFRWTRRLLWPHVLCSRPALSRTRRSDMRERAACCRKGGGTMLDAQCSFFFPLTSRNPAANGEKLVLSFVSLSFSRALSLSGSKQMRGTRSCREHARRERMGEGPPLKRERKERKVKNDDGEKKPTKVTLSSCSSSPHSSVAFLRHAFRLTGPR